MTMLSFFERRVYCLVRQQAPTRSGVLASGARLSDDLGLDLLGRVLLGISLEKYLHLDIPDTEIGQWRTVADVLACVARHRTF